MKVQFASVVKDRNKPDFLVYAKIPKGEKKCKSYNMGGREGVAKYLKETYGTLNPDKTLTFKSQE